MERKAKPPIPTKRHRSDIHVHVDSRSIVITPTDPEVKSDFKNVYKNWQEKKHQRYIKS